MQCRNPECDTNPTRSIRTGSFFVRSNHSVFRQMEIICCFVADIRVSRCADLLRISRRALTDYYDNLRGEYSDELVRNPIQFTSGPIYEVDELMLRHVLNDDGVYINQWILGMLERSTGKVLFIPVANRSAAVLLPLVQDSIPPHSLVFSDEWASYRQLNNLDYRHHHVNHSAKEYSRDEEIDGEIVKVHINTLEGMNRVVRQRFANKSTRVISRVDLILDEIVYRYSGRSLFHPFKV